MARVFISYSHDDRERARDLAAAIQDYGHEVWWDTKLVGGDDFREVIEDKLSQVDAIVVVWTETSVSKLWVKAEAHLGLERNNLVPVRFAAGFELPDEFAHVHVEYLGDWSGAPRAPEIGKLVGRIDQLKGEADRARLSAVLAPQLRAKVQSSSLVKAVFDAALPGGLRIYRFLAGALIGALAVWALLFGVNKLIGDDDTAIGLGIFPFLLVALLVTRGLDQLIIAAKRHSSDRFFDRGFSTASVICLLGAAALVLADCLFALVQGVEPRPIVAFDSIIALALGLLLVSYGARAVVTAGRALQSRV